MFVCSRIRILSKLENINCYKYIRHIHRNAVVRSSDKSSDEERPNLSKGILTKYEAFTESRAPIILDVEEERRKHMNQYDQIEEEEDDYNEFEGISPERGVEGVLEIDEVVDILRRENAKDIFVAEVPPEYRYVRYIVVVTGKSVRHMLGMATYVRKVFKYKRHEKDKMPMIEGEKSRDWIALDLGNIALHIFSSEARKIYDLESLWSLGKDYDALSNAPENAMVEMLKKYSVDLSSLEPADRSK